MSQPHFHETETGVLAKCYHKTTSLCNFRSVGLWIVITTISFPLEHYIWEQLEPFMTIAKMLGLT